MSSCGSSSTPCSAPIAPRGGPWRRRRGRRARRAFPRRPRRRRTPSRSSLGRCSPRWCAASAARAPTRSTTLAPAALLFLFPRHLNLLELARQRRRPFCPPPLAATGRLSFGRRWPCIRWPYPLAATGRLSLGRRWPCIRWPYPLAATGRPSFTPSPLTCFFPGASLDAVR